MRSSLGDKARSVLTAAALAAAAGLGAAVFTPWVWLWEQSPGGYQRSVGATLLGVMPFAVGGCVLFGFFVAARHDIRHFNPYVVVFGAWVIGLGQATLGTVILHTDLSLSWMWFATAMYAALAASFTYPAIRRELKIEAFMRAEMAQESLEIERIMRDLTDGDR